MIASNSTMITQFHVSNFKALRNVSLDLTPIHLLIGPNDSGKTSVLEAIAALSRSVETHLTDAFAGTWSGRDLVWRHENSSVTLAAGIPRETKQVVYKLSCEFRVDQRSAKSAGEQIVVDDKVIDFGAVRPNPTIVAQFGKEGGGSGPPQVSPYLDLIRFVHNALKGVHQYRFVPSMLAAPCAEDIKRQYRMNADGFGLALCLDQILGYDRERFMDLEKEFCRIFPQFQQIRLKPARAFSGPVNPSGDLTQFRPQTGKGLWFVVTDSGQEISSYQVSDGALLVLAYLTVFHLPQPPRFLLIEEPENGIHPARLKDILSIIREIVNRQSRTQVVMTTHSPYVVDLFQPQEVTLCRRKSDGSVSVSRLSQSKAVREQMDIFTLGEIWTGEGDESLAMTAKESEESE